MLEDDHFNILKYVSEDDRPIFDSMIQEAYNNQLSGSQGIMQYKKSDRTEIWLSLQIYFVRQEEDGQIYFVSARDDTERMLKVLSKQPAHRMLSAVLQMSNSNHSFKNLTEKNRRLAALVFGKLAPGGLIGGYCESGFPLYFANDAMVKLLGYKDYDDFCRGIGGMVENTIYPDDRRMVKKDVGDIYCPGEEYVTTYRMLRKDGTWFWVIDKGLVTEAEDGRPALISACTDISQIIEQQGKLIKNNSELLLQNEEMKYFYDMLPGAYHRCADTPDFDFLYISERFPEMFGYTRAQIAELFGNKLIHMIHPKDRKKVRRATQDIRERGLEKGLEYRVRGAQGYVWVLDETKYVEKDGGGFFVGVLLNITESKERERVSRLDLLTGVLNRNAAIPLIEEYLEKLPAGQTAAFLMMDMDNLKEINDKLGHDYGDAALVHCVNQIRQAIGRDAIIGRMGGDEFVMLCKNTSMPLLEHKLWVFRHEFSDVFTLRGHHANAEISLGYAFAPKDGYEFEELYHKADAALRRAKKSGKRTFKRYMESME